MLSEPPLVPVQISLEKETAMELFLFTPIRNLPFLEVCSGVKTQLPQISL